MVVTLDEVIARFEKKTIEQAELAKASGDIDCLECAQEYKQIVGWLKHYGAILDVLHDWSCDYGAITPDHTEKDKEYYFNKILDTFK